MHMHHGPVFFFLLEQEVDGETLISLGTCASMEQLAFCGLKTVKQQLTLKRLVQSFTTQPAAPGRSLAKDIIKEEKGKARKLTREEMNSLPPEEKRVYLMM